MDFSNPNTGATATSFTAAGLTADKHYYFRMTPAYLETCPKCGCRDLFVRKDFPQKLGLAVVAIAGVAFLILAARPHTFYLGIWILAAAVVIDALLYLFVRKITVCYRCRADFRDTPVNPAHRGFDLATAEKYRDRAIG